MDSIDNVFSAEGLYNDRSQESFGGIVIGVSLASLIISVLVASGIDRSKSKKIFEENREEILKVITEKYRIYREIYKTFKSDFIKIYNKKWKEDDILKYINFEKEFLIKDMIKEIKGKTNSAKKNEGYCTIYIELFNGSLIEFVETLYTDEDGDLTEKSQERYDNVRNDLLSIINELEDMYKQKYNEIMSIDCYVEDEFLYEGEEKDIDCHLIMEIDLSFLLKK